MKPEDKLQHKIVMDFSHKYPKYYGCLWALFNEDSKHKRALGMHTGASDLHMFANGIFAGIECKATGASHKITKIKQQLEWGENIAKNGGFYIMSADILEINNFIDNVIFRNYDGLKKISDICFNRVYEMISEAGSKKTIRF